MKKFDLMHQINTRGTYMVSKYILPYMKNSHNQKKTTSNNKFNAASIPQILNLSPPLLMEPKWFRHSLAYTMAKYGMSMCVMGMAAEFGHIPIAVNALWPRTLVLTAAMASFGGVDQIANICRKPDIIADAAYVLLSSSPSSSIITGNFFIDELVLRNLAGIKDFEPYSVAPGHQLAADGFIPDQLADGLLSSSFE